MVIGLGRVKVRLARNERPEKRALSFRFRLTKRRAHRGATRIATPRTRRIPRPQRPVDSGIRRRTPFTEALSQLNDRALRRLLGARAFLRGYDYVRRQAVTDVAMEDLSAKGAVRGTDPSRTR